MWLKILFLISFFFFLKHFKNVLTYVKELYNKSRFCYHAYYILVK